ncbi:LexA family protein [Chloroflexota bacterium]
MGTTARLTPRQHTFIDVLVELYREQGGPVHYSELADRVGVNRFSAYDMLKVLEKKGFASSSYALAAERTGPGRSMVVFAPTRRAAALLPLKAPELRLGEDWHKVRERVLERLREAGETSYRDVLNDLLSHLPETRAPLAYCTEMVGALLLNMQRARERAGGLAQFRPLSTLRQDQDAGLETLAGLSVGVTLAADDEAGPSFSQRLLEQAHLYQISLSRLSDEARSALAQFLEDALEALEWTSNQNRGEEGES